MKEHSMQLEGKTAFVTAAGTGIGRGTARSLAEEESTSL
jgi:NAD(P)-dependent dehydrogenase (short-subunit alcohol dehydrogenase family)